MLNPKSQRVIARSDSDEAIHASASGDMDCFAWLAMTAKYQRDTGKLHRQRNRIFHLAQRKARLDRGDAVEPGQLVLQECFIGRQVGGDDAQQIVAVAGHQIAFQHLVPFRDRLGKTIEVLLLLPRQLDRDEDADMQAERFLVDGCDIARDHAARFQQFHPAMARRYRQADLVGQFLHGHAAVGLQQAEDFAVDGVERLHWNKLGYEGEALEFYTNNRRYGAKIWDF